MKKVITKSFQGEYEVAFIEFDNEVQRMVLAKNETGAYIQPVKITKEEAERLVDFNTEKNGELGCDYYWEVNEETIKESKDKAEIAFIIASYLLSRGLFIDTENIYNKISNPHEFKVQLHKLIGLNDSNYNKSFSKLHTMIDFLITDYSNNFDIVFFAGYELLHKRRSDKNAKIDRIGKADKILAEQEAFINYYDAL